MNKKLKSLMIIMLAMSLVLVSCGGDNSPEKKPEEPNVSEETPAGDKLTSKENPVEYVNGEISGLEGPILLTSVGQSADVSMLDALMRKAELEYDFDATAEADDLDSYKTVIIAAGASSKGLGAAGISVEDEETRADKLLSKCEEEGITVIMAHLGGVARRGELSDKFSDKVIDYSKGLIVVEDGNDDGKFTDAAKDKDIPIILVNTIADTQEPLKEMFK